MRKCGADHALLFGIALPIAGFAEMAIRVNWLSAFPGLFTVLTDLFFYTPRKQRSWLSIAVGAIPAPYLQ